MNNKHLRAKGLLKHECVQEYIKNDTNPIRLAIVYGHKKIINLLIDNNTSLTPYKNWGYEWDDTTHNFNEYPMDKILGYNDVELINKGLAIGGKFSIDAAVNYKNEMKENINSEILSIVEREIRPLKEKQEINVNTLAPTNIKKPKSTEKAPELSQE